VSLSAYIFFPSFFISQFWYSVYLFLVITSPLLCLSVPCIPVSLTASSYFGHHCGAGLAKQSRGLHMGIIQAIARLEGQTAEVFACV